MNNNDFYQILGSILGKCDRETLLTSRLVSRRWAIYGSKELQKIVCILFQKSPFAPGEQRSRHFLTNRKRTLKDLIKVMNNSTEFPCTSFHFRDKLEGRTRQSSAQPFFDAHGAAIKKIKFEYVCIDDLKTFLLCQAPNLQELHLDRRVYVEYTQSTKRRPDLETQEQESERERVQESLFDVTTLKPKQILKNLKSFKCRVSLEVPQILLQQILECSPNLVDVTLPGEYIHLFVQPTNHVHLVKKLIIDITELNIESYELFANHLQDNKNFAVRELKYRTAENYHVDDDDEDKEFRARVANLMRKILRVSSATCRKLVWLEEVDNLEMPRMPQVNQLTINYYLQLDDGEDANDIENIVPVHSLRDCVSLGETFPNLKSLELRSRTDMGIHPIANIFNDVDPLPAANVKTVTMRLWHPRRKVVQSFEKMFPNAIFRKQVSTFSNDDGDSEKESGFDEDETDNDEESDCEDSASDESREDKNGDDESGDEENGGDENEDDESGEDENGDDENGDDENGDDENDGEENGDEEYNEWAPWPRRP